MNYNTRLLEALRLIKPRQPHLPQTNVIKSVCEHKGRRDSEYMKGWDYCKDCCNMIPKQ